MNENIYYVYFLIDPRDGTPFYIGKGSGDRLYDHFKGKNLQGNKNKIKEDKIKKIKSVGLEPLAQIHKDNMLEQDAYDLETSLIKHYGKIVDGTGILTNVCDDNRPPNRTGKLHTESTKELMSKLATGRVFTDEHLENLSKSHVGIVYGPPSQTTRDKISDSLIGKQCCPFKPLVCVETGEIFQNATMFEQYLKQNKLHQGQKHNSWRKRIKRDDYFICPTNNLTYKFLKVFKIKISQTWINSIIHILI